MVGEFGFVLTTVCLLVVIQSQSSDLTVSSKAKSMFQEVRDYAKYRYVIYYISDKKEINVESFGFRHSTYENFLQALNKLKDQNRFILYDYPIEDTTRLILLKWSPETANEKQKLLYTNGFEALMRELVGVEKFLQASNFDEATAEAIEEALK